MIEKQESNTGQKAKKRYKPTVLQVLPSLEKGGGGVERGAVDIALAVAKSGAKSLVASNGGAMARELERAKVPHFNLPLHSKNPWTAFANIGHLEKIIREHEVDIVHVRSRAPAWSAFFAARRAEVHFVTTFHGTYTAAGNFLKKHYNSIMTRGEKIIATSRFIKDHIQSNYSVDENRIRLIHRGIDLDHFDPDKVSVERVLQLAAKWRLPDGVPVVMLPGRMTRWKGQTMMIEALARLGRRDIRCILVGSDQGRTGYRMELNALLRKRGLSDIVHVVEHCVDMPAAYMMADVVVSASTDPEAFGRATVEAQALGRPVIAPDHGGARETLLPEKTGWLFPPGNVEGLTEVLGRVLDLDLTERKILSKTAIDYVAKNFSKRKMCDSTLAVYDEVMALGRAKRPILI